MPEPLDPTTKAQRLLKLPNWTLSVDGKTLHRTYTFRSFASAFGFMTSAAIQSEKLDHHPTWTNTYNKVEVLLTTHDAGDVTELDFKLARKFDTLYET